MLERAVKESEAKLKEHEKNPETHPLYADEWRQFWNRRYKELQAGKLHNTYRCNRLNMIRRYTQAMENIYREKRSDQV